MMKHVVFAILFAVTMNAAPAMAAPTLLEGHYEASGLVCAYNVAFGEGVYYAEGDDSARLRCRDAGVVLVFEPTAEDRFLHDFGTTAYEWTILSETSFVERVKVLRDGEWVTTTTLLFRLEE